MSKHRDIIDAAKAAGFMEFEVYELLDARQHTAYLHRNEPYGKHPYIVHLDDVLMNTLRFVKDNASAIKDVLEYFNVSKFDLARASLFHDSTEDGRLTYNDLKKAYGHNVAELVFAVSNGDGRNREERAACTFPKMRAFPPAIILKLSDRLANLTRSKENKSSMFDKYTSEHSKYVDELYEHSPFAISLWHSIEDVLAISNELLPETSKTQFPEEGD